MSSYSYVFGYKIQDRLNSNFRNIMSADMIGSSTLFYGIPGYTEMGINDYGKVWFYAANTGFSEYGALEAPIGLADPAFLLGGNFGFSIAATSNVGPLNAFNNFVFISEPSRNLPAVGNSGWGRVYLYGTNDISSLSESDNYQTLSSPGPAGRNGTRFGMSISLSAFNSNAFLVVGEFCNGQSGAAFRDGNAYLYKIAGDNKSFNYLSTLSLPAVSYDDHKCNNVRIYDDMIFVTANTATVAGKLQAGDAYYITYNPSTGATSSYTALPRNAGDIDQYDRFGTSISMDRNILAVGAPTDDRYPAPSYKGKVFLYKRTGSSINFLQVLTPPASFNGFPINNTSTFFGTSVSVVRDQFNANRVNILVGSLGFFNGMIRRGSVFVYRYDLLTDTATLNNIITLTPDELACNPGNRFGGFIITPAKPSPDYTIVLADFIGNDSTNCVTGGVNLPYDGDVEAGASNFAYIYAGQDFLNTSTPVMYTSASYITPGPFLRNETLGVNSTFDPSSTNNKTLKVDFGEVVSLSAGIVNSNPESNYYWYKNYDPDVANIPVGTGPYVNLGSVSFSNAGTYVLSAVNLIGSGLAINSSAQTYQNLLMVQGEPFSGGNRVMPDSGDLSLAGELAYDSFGNPIYRSISFFIKNYNSIGLTTPASLDQREKDYFTPSANSGTISAPVQGSKLSTGVDVGFNLSYLSAMSGQLEMGRTQFTSNGAPVKYNWTPASPTTGLRPARMSEFYKAYKWYTVQGTNPPKCFTSSQRSNAGWAGGPVGPGPDNGTIVVTPANNMITNNFYVRLLSDNGGSLGGGSGKSMGTWYLGAPSVQFDEVGTGPQGSSGKNYTIYVMDENGYGWANNIQELQSTITLKYP